jgi:hypothetical protein
MSYDPSVLAFTPYRWEIRLSVAVWALLDIRRSKAVGNEVGCAYMYSFAGGKLKPSGRGWAEEFVDITQPIGKRRSSVEGARLQREPLEHPGGARLGHFTPDSPWSLRAVSEIA